MEKMLRAEESGKGELQSVEFPWQTISGSPITHSLFGAIPHTRVNTEHFVFLGHEPLLWQDEPQCSKGHGGIYSWSLTAHLRVVQVFRPCFAHS